ncbi:MAG: WG repeat-containing protein [Lachnospiraceae bacterium]|nr:WG repeat-containing protein [Lachnospiraceae bacterium]
MKGKKLMLALISIAVVIACWIAAVMAFSGVKEKQQQASLYAEAVSFDERGLYARAIPKYKEALAIRTDLNNEIEDRLLAAYHAHGDKGLYTDLVLKREKNGRATEEEYMQAAEYLIASYKREDAMNLVKRGIEKFDSEKLKEYYENTAYAYRANIAEYAEILSTSSRSDLMPAYNGEGWFYLNDYGWPARNKVYEAATPYNKKGYAAVRENGVYYIIDRSGELYAIADPSITDVSGLTASRVLAKKNGTYSYYDLDFQPLNEQLQFEEITRNADGVAAVKTNGRWGILADDLSVVVEPDFDDIALNALGSAFAGGHAMVKKGDAWHLIDTTGADVCEQTWADARAPESDGWIAVANAEGKWGFIDPTGAMKIDYQFEDAASFSDGLAAVEKINRWYYISTNGRVQIEENMTEARAFHDGRAIAITPAGAMILTLEYVSK